MRVEDLDIGDIVYAASTICDNHPMPDGGEGMILAEAGARGVIAMIGHVEDQPERSVFLVCFEDKDKKLGSPIGCWIEDLLVEPKRVN